MSKKDDVTALFLSILFYGAVHHVAAEHPGERHGDCVDNLHYFDVEYNVTTKSVCMHKVERVCQKKKIAPPGLLYPPRDVTWWRREPL